MLETIAGIVIFVWLLKEALDIHLNGFMNDKHESCYHMRGDYFRWREDK
jgi:hypothetical protein